MAMQEMRMDEDLFHPIIVVADHIICCVDWNAGVGIQ